ncbi:MAG: hypothetical protein K2H64_03105 [Desulfovibrio sp.]|nr:hypothetical protein [Desulfovibrio sp.]
MQLKQANVISANTLVNLVKGKGLLTDDFIPEDEAAKIANELMANGVGASPLGEALKLGI